eukprot:361689-Chlamydomonas_euryale.AAC.11
MLSTAVTASTMHERGECAMCTHVACSCQCMTTSACGRCMRVNVRLDLWHVMVEAASCRAHSSGASYEVATMSGDQKIEYSIWRATSNKVGRRYHIHACTASQTSGPHTGSSLWRKRGQSLPVTQAVTPSWPDAHAARHQRHAWFASCAARPPCLSVPPSCPSWRRGSRGR